MQSNKTNEYMQLFIIITIVSLVFSYYAVQSDRAMQQYDINNSIVK